MVRLLVFKFVRYGTYLFIHPSSYEEAGSRHCQIKKIFMVAAKNLKKTDCHLNNFPINCGASTMHNLSEEPSSKAP